MSTVNLSTWERVTLVSIVNSTRGDAGAMRKCMALLDLLELTEDEKTAIDYKLVPTPNGMGASWDVSKEPAEGYPIEFKDGNHLAYLRQLLKGDDLFVGADARKIIKMIDKLEA